MACDPGNKNFAYAILRITWKVTGDKVKLLRIDTLAIGKLKNPLNNLTDSVNHEVFLQELEGLISEYKPDELVIERFQTRGAAASFMGAIIETVNVQIGTIITLCYKKNIAYRMIIAVTWKSAIKRAGLRIEDLYKVNKKNHHVIDAFLMALFQTDCLDYLKTPKRYQKFVETVNKL